MTPAELLTALRADAALARAAWVAIERATTPAERARQAERRGAVVGLLAASLRPTDRALARRLLVEETAELESIGRGASETLYTLVALVARFAQPDDALLLWRARQATPETREGVDVEQALRAGVAPVRRWLGELAESASPSVASEARAALAWVEAGIAAGAQADLPGYFAWADERFGLTIAGPV